MPDDGLSLLECGNFKSGAGTVGFNLFPYCVAVLESEKPRRFAGGFRNCRKFQECLRGLRGVSGSLSGIPGDFRRFQGISSRSQGHSKGYQSVPESLRGV